MFTLEQLISVSIWILAPTLFDICICIYTNIKIFMIYIFSCNKKYKELVNVPLVSIIVPVFNSKETLDVCIKSIVNQTYGIKNIEILLVDNGDDDGSYSIFEKYQKEYKQLRIWWYKSKKGKSKALNTGVYYARGKYVVFVDSDGYINKEAIMNLICKFEDDERIDAITGCVIIDIDDICCNNFTGIISKCEYIEYLEVFFIGKKKESVRNKIFTMAGAISAIRKDTLLKTQLYNTATIAEDAHMTQEILSNKGIVSICENSIFFTKPTESLNRLSIQRSRWQTGALQVASDNKFKNSINIKRRVIIDHSMLILRVGWIFSEIYLLLNGVGLITLIKMNVVLYLLYVFLNLLYLCNMIVIFNNNKKIQRQIIENLYIAIFLPVYRLITLFFRLNGTINSFYNKSEWNVRGVVDEIKIGLKLILGKDN